MRGDRDVCWPEEAAANPLVSVVIPTYNRGRILVERSLASVLNQTYSNLEVIVVGDHANDFYGTVDVTVVLNADATQVGSVLARFGEDSEGITRSISYTGTAPAKGTSAKLSAAGQRYQISGNGLAVETRNGKDSSRLIPYALDLTCSVS